MMKNFKNIILVLLVSSITSNAFSQNSDLDSMAKAMFEKTNNRDFDALLDMTYPKVYELVPKEAMKNLFVSMFEGTGDMSIDLPKITPVYKLSEVYNDKESDTEYAFLTYDMSMSMTFKNEGMDEDAQEMMLKMFKVQGMEASFETDNKVNVLAPNRMVIFLKDKATNNKWSMINYDSNSPLFVQLLPVNVLEKSKSYYQDILIESKKKN